MADADDTKAEEKQEDERPEKTDERPEKTGEEPEKTDEKAPSTGVLTWVIMAVIVLVCAGAGFGLGRLFAGSRTPQTAEPSWEDKSTRPEDLKVKADGSVADSQKTWYYDLEPVVSNLDVPGVTRYVRAVLTLEISPEVDKDKGGVFIDEKKPVLTNWLTIYLASLTLDDIRGDRNLKRIQSQILDSFNEKLFPDAKPQIKHILFKEFAIQ